MKLVEVFDPPEDEVPVERKAKAAFKLLMNKKYANRRWEQRYKETNPENAFNRLKHAHSRGKTPSEEDLKIIEKDANASSEYATNVLRGRFLRGEEAISKSPLHAVPYAQWTLRRRWPEAEPYIAKHGDAASRYATYFFDSRWPEAEPAIMQNPGAAGRYAKKFKFRLPPALEAEVFKTWVGRQYKKAFGIP